MTLFKSIFNLDQSISSHCFVHVHLWRFKKIGNTKFCFPKCQLFLPPISPSLPPPPPSVIVWLSFILDLFQKKKKKKRILSCQYSPSVQFLSWFLTWLPCVFDSEEGDRRVRCWMFVIWESFSLSSRRCFSFIFLSPALPRPPPDIL